MTLHALARVVAGEPSLASTVSHRRGGAMAADVTAPPALRPFLISALAGEVDGANLLAVTATAREAEDLVEELGCLIGPEVVAYYPAWETLPHERLSPRSDTVGRRLAVLRRLIHPTQSGEAGPVRVVVAPVRSLLQPQVKGLADLTPVELATGEESELDDVVRRLADAAYMRVDLVERRGEFAVRGGIIDVFPPTEDHPLRVEFFGDTVEEIRHFAVADQRSLDKVEQVWAPPCRELLLSPPVRARARVLAEEHPGSPSSSARSPRVTPSRAWSPSPRCWSTAWRCSSTCSQPMPRCWCATPSASALAPTTWWRRARSSCRRRGLLPRPAARPRSTSARPPTASSTTYAVTCSPAAGRGGPRHRSLDPDASDDAGASSRTLAFTAAPTYRGDTEQALLDMKGWLADRQRIVLLTPAPGQSARSAELLGEHDIAAAVHEQVVESALTPDVVHVVTADIAHGFIAGGLDLVVLTQDDLVGQRPAARDERRLPARRRRQIDPLELSVGDHVVHEQHGVGRYVEMMQRVVAGATREYLVIEYAASKRGQPADRLFVPTDQLDQISRYVGGESPRWTGSAAATGQDVRAARAAPCARSPAS
ncbi:MAG: CarD family transcriptional regulator [Nocardioidaceae bacterium]